MIVVIGIIIILIIVAVALYALLYGAMFFIAAIAYGYWGVSVGMAPVMWLIMLISTIMGFFIALKNAIKAVKTLNAEE